jgi:hypothetical protein
LTKQLGKQKSIWLLLPFFGTLLFVTLYVIATFFYPGGSQADKNSTGFSWADNYWCNLLNEPAINGQHNPAKPIAMTGMLILCLSLSYFWFLFPRHVNVGKFVKSSIQISGAVAMTIAFFLFANIDHDMVINSASIFGLIATIGTFIGLYKVRWYGLLTIGFFIILLVGLNNYFYNNKALMVYLPIVQKISFATFLVWVCGIDINLYRRINGIDSRMYV